MTDLLPHITLESGKQRQEAFGRAPARHSIIWLHGLGADGQDFVPIVDELSLPVTVRFIFPHAPQRPVTINGGYVMRAWYDISGSAIDTQQDEAGIRASQAAIEALIAQEVARGIAPDHIFLAGFSQGGAIALHTALRQVVPLGGVLALSCYLPLVDRASSEVVPDTRSSPIFMAHGRSDTVVPYALGLASRDELVKLGYAVEWREYPMQHSVCEQELRDIESWLAGHMRLDGNK